MPIDPGSFAHMGMWLWVFGNCGYFIDSGISGIRKLLYQTESFAAIADTMSHSAVLSGVSNSGVAGYQGGGSSTDVINKLNYANDQTSTLSAVLSNQRQYTGGMSNGSTAGYFAGGNAGSTEYDVIDKLAISAETISTLSAVLSAARSNIACVSRQGTAGYTGGGSEGASVNVATMDKLTYSSDTRSTLGATLNTAVYAAGNTDNEDTSGYFYGGFQTTPSTAEVDVIQKLTYSSETDSTLSAVLNNNRSFMGGCNDADIAGYVGPDSDTTINKLLYATETQSTLTYPASAAQLCVLSNNG